MMPGTRLLAFARLWFSPVVVATVFEPLVADWQREWIESPTPKRARVAARGLASFVCAAIVSSPRVLRTAAPATVTNRVVRRIASITLITAVIMTIPMSMQIDNAWSIGLLMLAILPSTMTVVFPFAMVAAVDAIRRHEPLPEHVQRAAVLKLGLVAVVLMVTFGGWVVPGSNQVWRVAMAEAGRQSFPEPGLRELSTFALIADPSRASAPARFTRAGEIRKELNNRAVLAVLPVLLLWLRWLGLERPRNRWYSPVPVTAATIAAYAGFFTLYFSGFIFENQLNLLPGTGLWLPVFGFSTIALIHQWWLRRTEAHA